MHLEDKVSLYASPRSPYTSPRNSLSNNQYTRSNKHRDSVSSTGRRRSNTSVRKRSETSTKINSVASGGSYIDSEAKSRHGRNDNMLPGITSEDRYSFWSAIYGDKFSKRPNTTGIYIDPMEYGDILRRVPNITLELINILPIDSAKLDGMNRTQRMRFLYKLSMKTVPVRPAPVLSRVFKHREDCASLLIKALALQTECDHTLVGELVGLAPPDVLQNLLDSQQRFPFLRPQILPRLIHAAARKISQVERRGVESLLDQNRDATRLIIDLVAELFQSFKLPTGSPAAGQIGGAASGPIQSLKCLLEARDSYDEGVQIGIVLAAIKKLAHILNDKTGRKTKHVLFALRIAVGLLGLAPIAGSVAAGALPVIEKVTALRLAKRKAQTEVAMRKILDACYDFENKACAMKENMEERNKFNDGLRWVQQCIEP